eukprot:m.12618 g.12618  ORF g.12618 m.12618 type:complete len:462 (+) comp4309_c0_seq1:162-1547(+)
MWVSTLNTVARRSASSRVLQRSFSAVAQTKPLPGLPNVEADTTPETVSQSTLSNGITVASTDSATAATGHVAVVVAAGSRYETIGTAGAAQVLRASSFQSTDNHTGFSICRTAEALGSSLSTSLNRENIVYSSTFLKDNSVPAITTLADSIVGASLHSWEVKQAIARASAEAQLELGNPGFGVAEDLHAAAFRRGLGNTFSSSPAQLSRVSADAVKAFSAAALVPGRVAIVGSGVDHDTLVALAEEYFGALSGEAAKPAASAFAGNSEIRTPQALGLTHFAFGFQGAAIGAGASAAVLTKLLGAPSSIKWSAGAHASPVTAMVAEAATGPFDFSSFSAEYSDAGLVGVHGVVAPADAAIVTKAAYTAIKNVLSGSFTDDDVTRAKNQAAAEVLAASRADSTARTATTLLHTSQLVSAVDLASQIQAVAAADVKKAAAVAGASKPVYVVRGELFDAPYFDEL